MTQVLHISYFYSTTKHEILQISNLHLLCSLYRNITKSSKISKLKERITEIFSEYLKIQIISNQSDVTAWIWFITGQQ